MINDISAGREDNQMFSLAARTNSMLCLMHMQGTPSNMQSDPRYEDVVGEVASFLKGRTKVALDAGVKKDQLLIDPGIGFGKTLEHNLELIANLESFVALNYPVVLGVSRKRMFDELGKKFSLAPAKEHQRLGGTAAATAIATQAGVWAIRVHDVQPNRQAANLAWLVNQGNISQAQTKTKSI